MATSSPSPSLDEMREEFRRLEAELVSTTESLARLENSSAKTTKSLIEKMDIIDREANEMRETLQFFPEMRVKLGRLESEIVGLHQTGQVSSSSPRVSTGMDKYPVPMFSGDRDTLTSFLKLFRAWAFAQKS